MANAIPKWVQERYAKLWKKFKDKKITYKQMEDTLTLDDKNTISAFLNELKGAGWLKVELDNHNTRIRLYTLKSPEKAIIEMKQK